MKRTCLLNLVLLAILLLTHCYPIEAQVVASNTRTARQMTRPTTTTQTQSLRDVLNEFKTRYGVDILFEDRLVIGQVVPATTIESGVSVEKNLDNVLRPQGLRYKKIKAKVYAVLSEAKARKVTRTDAPQTLNLEPGATTVNSAVQTLQPLTNIANAAADVSVTGQVLDDQGANLPGVSVVVKGSQRGTTTNANGNFTISVPDRQAVLVFSFVGYQSREVPVGNQVIINITLTADNKTLNEVIVVGYGTVKKSDLTGSVASLKAEDFNPGANASVDQLILGRSPGVQITQSSSEPGGGVSVRIRGASSLNAGNEPLYVIDGLPLDNSSSLSSSPGGNVGTGTNQNPRNPLNSINPNDIASIEILKDASATAIYGSRGANGVILITTKRGSKGKIGVSYDMNLGIQNVPKLLNVLGTADYIKFMNGVAKDEGRAPEFSDADIARIGAGTNWQEQIYQQAPLSSHNLSISGGDDNTTFFSSFNYFKQDGVLKNSGIKKYIARVNLERKFGKKVKLGINLNTSVVNDLNSIDGLNNNENAGPINASLLYDPTEPVYKADGNFAQSKNLTINNPVSLIDGIKSTNTTNRTLGNLYLNYTIIPGLDAKLNFGSDRQTARRDLYNSTRTLNGASAGGIANIATLERSNVLFEYTMNYNRKLTENSTFGVLGGITYQYFNNRNFGGTIRGFASDALATNNLGLGDTNNDNLTSGQEDNTLLSYLGRVNYSLKDKYLLTASLRADGSSRFGENNKYGYFPSVAAGWRLSEEPFIPNFFYDLKLRGSWGITGNQDIANYASLTTYTTGSNAVFNNAVSTGTQSSRIANPNLKWESTEQANIGIDASILQGRISLTLDYFVKNTRDMLINLPIPRATGFSSVLTNIGRMENKGVEILLSSTNINQKQFKWSTTLNLAAIRNKVKDIGNIPEIVTGFVESIGNTAVVRVGYPAYSYYGYNVLGIFQTADNIAGSAQPTAKPGYPIFGDVNGDKRITPTDQVIIGSPFPNFTFGIQNTFTYKRLQLDVFFQGQQGASLLNINVLESLYPNNARRNRLAEQGLNRWTVDNPNTRWPSGANPSAYGGGKVNSLTLQDASYLRLKSVQVSYNLPVQKIKFIQSARLYVVGQNLATFTNYIGFDPEANAFGRSNVRIDYNGYPLARTYMLGLNIGF